MHTLPEPEVLRQLGLPGTLERLLEQQGSDCSAWAAALHLEADVHLKRGESDAAAALRLVARACDPLLEPEDPDGPYLARFDGTGARTARPADLSAAQLNLLDLTATLDSPACWQARVADFQYLARGEPHVAARAFACFLRGAGASADLDASELWPATIGLLRAADLVPSLPDPRAAREALAAAVGALLPRAAGDASPILLHTLLKVAWRIERKSLDRLVSAATERGRSEVTRGSFHWGRAFFAHARRFLDHLGSARQAETLAILRATLFADEARSRRNASEPVWISAALLAHSIRELRRIEDTGGLVEGLQRELDAMHCEEGASGPQAGVAQLLEDVVQAFDHAAPEERPLLMAALPVERFAAAHCVLPRELAWDRSRREWKAESGEPAAALPAAPDPWVLRLWSEGPIEELRRRWAADPLCRASLDELVRDNPVALGADGRATVRGVEACLTGDVRQGRALLVPALRAAAPGHGLSHAFTAVLDVACSRPCDHDRNGEQANPLRSLRIEANLALWGALRLLTQRSAGAVLHAPRVLSTRTAGA